MGKKLVVTALVILMAVSLTGCFDAREIGDYAYISMVGIDEGVTNELRLTFHIPEFQVSGSGSDSGGGGNSNEKEKAEKEVITLDAPSLLSGVSILNNSVPKILNFMHMKAIIISEKMAKSGKAGKVVTGLMKYRQVRGTTNIIVCRGTAEEFIKAFHPYQGGLITDSIEELVTRAEYTGFITNSTFMDMYDRIKSATSQFLAIYGSVNDGKNLKESRSGEESDPESRESGEPEEEKPVSQNEGYGSGDKGRFRIPGDYLAGETPVKGGPDIELFGSAVFDGDKMVGTLTGFETQMVRIAIGRLNRAAFTIQDPLSPDLYIPIEVKEFGTPKVSIDLSGQRPMINMELKLEGDITSIPSRIEYEDEEKNRIFEQAFEEFIKTGLERTFKKGQELKTDVFDLGQVAIKQFLTIPEWEKYKWKEKVLDAELNVKVDFIVRRTGKTTSNKPAK
ncbi:MAG TPA: Ger(x)C family spore germination protein [Clostridiaceae bacterium]|nr:Ger(x)C family spore germination protein [Clostridiaceae bacterium]